MTRPQPKLIVFAAGKILVGRYRIVCQCRDLAADLVVIGSNCTGLDLLVGLLERDGLVVRSLAVGSQGGLTAAARGACDLAGIHLMDPATGEYNRPLLPPGVTLARGYGRLQGVVVRADDARFAGCTTADAVAALDDPSVLMVNRNADQSGCKGAL